LYNIMSGTQPNNNYNPRPPAFGVFVGNLDSSVTDLDLRREFSQCGTVIDSRIIRDSNGMSKKFGFVNFLTDPGRVKALDTMDRVVINGSAVNVRNKHNSGRESDKIIMKPGAHARDIYCGGIPLDATGQDIKSQLESHLIQGINEVRVKSGYCFVSFFSAQHASIGLETMRRGQVPSMCGKPVVVQGNASSTGIDQMEKYTSGTGSLQWQIPGTPLTPRQQWMAEKATRTLYVSNLKSNATEQALEGLISTIATVRQVTIVKDDVTGAIRGYGFVELETSDEVQKVLAIKHQLAIDGQQLNVQVSKPPKEVQDALILQQTNQLIAQPQYYQDPSTGQVYMLPSAPQAQIMYAPTTTYQPTAPLATYLHQTSIAGGLIQPPSYIQANTLQPPALTPAIPPPPVPPPPMPIPANVPLQGQRFSPY